MKKLLSVLFAFLIAGTCFANDTLTFNFPNEGWHKVESPDGITTKKCYVPYNQTSENYREMLIFMQRKTKNTGISPMVILQKKLGKDRLNYFDIEPAYIKQDFDDAMVTWCSKSNNVCSLQRAFQGNEGVILVSYINKMPHYSQNIFGQWSNILGSIKLYDGETAQSEKIEL